MRTHTPRGALAATVLALALVVTACGDDGGSDAADETATSTTAAAPVDETVPGNPDTTIPTGEEICAAITDATVGSTLEIDVTGATPSDPGADVAPSCAYAYQGAEGPATVTISALRPLDMNGRTGAEGYKAFIAANKAIAAEVDYEEVPVEVGREAVRFTGATTHAAISDTGVHVVQVVVPKDDASGEQVDTLLATVVDAIG
jgi:hypothetical protein